MANKSLGQHFLRNKSAVHAIVAALDPQPNETIIEIGPGHGELTLALPIANSELRIFVIEKDGGLAESLESKINALGKNNVTVLRGDALTMLPTLIDDPESGIRNYKIVGNIPYYITGHLLRIIGELPEEKKPERCVFTVQEEVAERIVAKAGAMNRLAASVAYWADAKIVMSLSQKDFVPVPKVTSAIILLNHKPHPAFPDQNRYYSAVRALFSQPRKIILNNLAYAREANDKNLGEKSKEELALMLQGVGIPSKSRPQDITPENIARVAEAFF